MSVEFLMTSLVVVATHGTGRAEHRRRRSLVGREHVMFRPRVLAWIRRAFAGAFAALGARLAVAEGGR